MPLGWDFLWPVYACGIFLRLVAVMVGDTSPSSSESGAFAGVWDAWNLFAVGVSPLLTSWGRFKDRRAEVGVSSSIGAWSGVNSPGRMSVDWYQGIGYTLG